LERNGLETGREMLRIYKRFIWIF